MKTNLTQANPDTKVAQPLNVLSSQPNKGDDVNLSKHSKLQIITGIAALLCSAQLFVACQPNGGGRSNPSAIDGKSGAHISPPILGGAGTGDSTGGNGMNNKVFEAYSVDITQTPEWKEHIAPIEAHFETLPLEKDQDFKGLFTLLAKTKTWYIAPVALDEIQKANLGVEFIKDPIQQLALQTDKAVWIDKTSYGSKDITSLDRAYLQTHETMVALYLMRFKTANELCVLTSKTMSQCDGNPLVELIIGPPEAKRKLESVDYERIRAMTAWMLHHAKNVKSFTEIRDELYRQGFDPRLFKPKDKNSNSLSEQKEITLDPSTRAKALINAKVLGRFPKNCDVHVSGVTAAQACDVNIDLLESSEGQALTMNFSLLVNGNVQYFTMTRISLSTSSPMKLYSTPRPVKDRDLSAFPEAIGMAFPSGPGPLQIGQDVYSVYVTWDETGTSVKDIVLTNLRIVKVIPAVATNYLGFKFTSEDFDVGAPNPSETKNFVFTSDTPDAPELREIGYMSGRVSAIRSAEVQKK